MNHDAAEARFVLAIEGGDLSAFRSSAEACRWIEEEDALGGGFVFVTGNGRPLAPEADKSSRAGWKLCENPGDPVDVRSIVLGYLDATEPGRVREFPTLPTRELLELLADLEDQGRR